MCSFIAADIFRSDAGTYQRWNGYCLTDGAHFLWVGGAAGGNAGYDHAVCAEKFGCFGGLDDVHIGGDGVRRVFLFYVGKDPDFLGANCAAITQQLTGAGLDQALIGNMSENKSLYPHKTRSARMGHGKGP